MSPSQQSGFAGPGHVVLLMAGLLLGVLAGPAVWGRWSPPTYREAFPDSRQIRSELDAIDQTRHRLAQTGVTPTALQEYDRDRGPQREALRAELARAQEHVGRLHALAMALVVVLGLLGLLKRGSPWRGRLTTLLYAIAAVWLAGWLAQPNALAATPLGAIVVLILGGAILAWLASLLALPHRDGQRA